jgi:hypothetical protein
MRSDAGAKQRDELALFHCLAPPGLPTERNSTPGTAALRDFEPVDVADGSNSALGRCPLNVRITPESGRVADIRGRLKSAKSRREHMQRRAVLFDHLISAGEHRGCHFDAGCLCRLEVDTSSYSTAPVGRPASHLLKCEYLRQLVEYRSIVSDRHNWQ